MLLNRRGGLFTAVLALTVLFAVACGSDDNNTSSSATTTSGGGGQAAATTAPGAAGTQAAAQNYTPLPKDQQVLRIPYAEPNFLDPHKSQFAQDIGVERMLFKGLFSTDDKGNVIPMVAREVPTTANGGIASDGKTIKVSLKDNQKWSDGSALTAKDFEYAIRRAFNPDLASPYASFVFNIVGSEEYYTAKGTAAAPKSPSADELNRLRDAIGVKALDDRTLEFKLKEPQGTFPVILGLWVTYPVKQSVVEASGGPENTNWTAPGKLIGNGPFVLKERREKDRIVVEANPNYTLEPKPKLQRIELRIIEDSEAQFQAFQSGEIDLTAIPTSKIPVVDGDPNLKKQNIRVADPTTWGIEFNHSVKPLDNQKVRLAIAQAVDREAFVKVVLGGVGKATQCWLPEGTPGYDVNDCTAQKYDPTAAKKNLADAGFANGQGFPRLSFLTSDTQRGRDIAEFVANQLKTNLGINVDIEQVDAKTRSSRYSNSQWQLFFGGWREDYHDPENWLPELFGTGAGNNQAKYSNAQFDDLMKQAKFEVNNEKRISLYKQAHKLLVDDAARGMIYNPIRNVLVAPRVKGLIASPLDSGFTGDFFIVNIELGR